MIGMTLGRIAACCGGVYFGEEEKTVSYTHLTLPTILLV